MCPWQESNLRPSGPQPDALSTELQGRIAQLPLSINCQKQNVIKIP